MADDTSIRIRLSAQRALLGQVSASLRAVSVDADAGTVYYRCIFDAPPLEDERELLSVAASEIIADFPAPYVIEEEYLYVPEPGRMEHLKYVVFLRYEKPIEPR
jgi:hypothetical protein